MPTCPAWLGPAARSEYRRLARMLVELRVMTEADRTALAAYAHEFDQWRTACEMVKVQGPVLIGANGGSYLNPWQNIANTHFKNMTKMLTEFGLTPASRSRIEAQPEEQKAMSLAEKLFASVGTE